jgi:hypothetical protein
MKTVAALAARVRELEITLAQAALPLEVLAVCIAREPYRELTDDLQNEIMTVIPLIRAAISNRHPYPSEDTKFQPLG